tara:strand:+ start:244 stop:1029 length:786 start_codon:yes stop_codon:yes gene_type:complete
MKKIFVFILFSFFWFLPTNAFNKWGEGELQLTEQMVNYFAKYLRGKGNKNPADFYVTLDGTDGTYWTCGTGHSCSQGDPKADIRRCEELTGKKCKKFARMRTVRWKNGINTGKSRDSKFSSKMTDEQLRVKLNKLGFYNNNFNSSEKKEKKVEKKTAKKYSLSGERSLALSWDGYSNLIAGTVKFDEADYKGTLNLSLPNNDGSCAGSYSLQSDGKGTWQISCTNNMGAAGTLKWIKDGGVTGTGRDHKDKKVKFTVSKPS